MMTIDYISQEVKRIQKKYDEKDPYGLCRAMNISLLFSSMGTGKEACKRAFIFCSPGSKPL